MYPQRELTRLNAYKVALLRDALSASHPLVWLDRLLVFWKRITPLTLFAAVPLSFILKRTPFPHLKILGSLVRWGPIAFAILQSIRSLAARRTEP